ncbi:MAG TPA: hypothetical protein VIV40_04270 [Kofleriaceae bacterium]
MLLAVSACAGGGMHQATLVGQCAANDAACSRKAPLAPLAIGARFYPEVATEIAGSSTPNLRLESAEPSVLAVEDGALVAKSAGTSAVLISTDDGSVVDFVHVWVAPVTQITLARRDGERITGSLGLAVGEDVTLVPSLFNGAQKLAGDSAAQWTVDNAGPLVILQDGSSDRRRLRARAPGKTKVTVALGTATASIDVEVVP